MTRIRFTKTIDSLLKGADHLLIVAPKSRFDHPDFLDRLPETLRHLALELAGDLEPKLNGAVAGTLTSDSPRRLSVAVLPDEVSRHNAPSRAEAIRNVVVGSNAGRKGSSAILLVLDHDEHYAAAAGAVGKALPLYSKPPRKQPRASAEKTPAEPKLAVCALGPEGEALAPPRSVGPTVDAAREAARLVDTPPTELNPKRFQAEASKLLRGLPGVTRKAFVGEALLREGLGGIHAVGRTALEEPRMLVYTYTPKAKNRARRHIALVGKGVTYDTGGLSLKISGTMAGMKIDMGGAAAVLGAFYALVKSGSPCKVSAVICLAENSIGPAAVKPDDVIRMHSGMTVEVNNTDAEGRLLLADGVSYAARILKADTIIDIATLTGAQGVATGDMHGALVAGDEELETTLWESGRRSGDLVHPIPYAPEFYRAEFESQVADMKNSVANRMNAQSSCAAEFIHWHLDGTDARWAHVDMAFPVVHKSRGTGYGVALLAQAVNDLTS